MIILVMGSSASGKSAIAESLVTGLRIHPRYYIATMMPYDDEGKKRVEKHRRMREGKGFLTRERYLDLVSFVPQVDGDGIEPVLDLNSRGTALLECMSNLVANEMFDPKGAGAEKTPEAVVSGVKHLASTVDNLVIVSNDVFADGIEYDEYTTRYLDVLGGINAALADLSDVVIEAVCGIPVFLKGNKEHVEFL